MPQRDLTAPALSASGPRGAAPFVGRRAVVTVPATCANLGPGFDCVALALDLRNTFAVSVRPHARGGAEPGDCQVELAATRDDTPDLAAIETGADNLFCRAFALVCERMKITPPDLRVRIDAQVPPSRGLGSSATAVVGGLLAANTLLGQPLSLAELLPLAVACEPGGHADNVAAALHGGLVVTGADEQGAGVLSLPLPVPDALRAVVFIPDMPMSTVAGRALLPERYARGDVTFNLSRVALLLGALQTGRYDALGAAMADRVHQPYRERIFPALPALVAAARAAGAHGACLSGGGSSVLALVSADAEQVGTAMARAAEAAGVSGRWVSVALSQRGAVATLSAGAESGATKASRA